MATYTGSSGSVTVATNTIAEITGFSIEETAPPIDDTNLNDAATTVKAGRTSWTASVEAFYDSTDTTAQGAMLPGSELAFVFYVEGNTSGKPSKSGSGVITSVSTSVSNDAIVTKSFSVTGNGALTTGTVV